MPIRVDCNQCEAKISVDDAFAGSVCRCPYCKAMVVVPRGGGEAGDRKRPAAPVSRPVAPPSATRPISPPPGETTTPGGSELNEAQRLGRAEGDRKAHARKSQMVMAIIGLLLIVALVGAVVIMMRELSGPEDSADQQAPSGDVPGQPASQQKQEQIGPNVAGQIAIFSPVIYVLDAGQSMARHYGKAAKAVIDSVDSLNGQGQFNLLIVGEEKIHLLSEKLLSGGADGAATARSMLEGTFAGGATSEDLAKAINQAIEQKPAAVIVLTAKEIEQASELGKLAATKGVKIHVVSLVDADYINENLKKLAAISSGEFTGLWD